MTRFFRISLAGLALLLVLILGLSEVAHAATKSCSGGPCNPIGTQAEGLDHATVAHHPAAQTEAEHDNCNPSLCHVVALAVAPMALPQTVEFMRYLAESPPLRDLLTPEEKDRPPRL